MKTLLVTNELVWDILGNICEDNGDVCDGAMIANPSHLTNSEMELAVSKGCGKIIDVEVVGNDEEMLKILNLPKFDEEMTRSEQIEVMEEMAYSVFKVWAYYWTNGEWYFIR